MTHGSRSNKAWGPDAKPNQKHYTFIFFTPRLSPATKSLQAVVEQRASRQIRLHSVACGGPSPLFDSNSSLLWTPTSPSSWSARAILGSPLLFFPRSRANRPLEKRLKSSIRHYILGNRVSHGLRSHLQHLQRLNSSTK